MRHWTNLTVGFEAQRTTDACRDTGGADKERSLEKPKARSLEEIRAALEGCYSSMEALCSDLTDAEWQARSLCPDWTVRGVNSRPPT